MIGRSARALVSAIVLLSCASKDETRCDSAVTPSGPPITATTHAVVDIDRAPARTLYAVSDIHGGYDRLVALLAASHVIEGAPASPSLVRWSAGDSILVVAGDLVDKGPQPVEVIDVLRALEGNSKDAGGLVVVLLGNHEAEFFADPSNDKASGPIGLNRELAAENIDCGKVASGIEPRGEWLRARPLGARIGKWFFAHAGNTKQRSLADLDAALRDALLGPASFGADEIVGPDSLLEARGWYDDPAVTTMNAHALGVAHFVFGHDPNALGPRGTIATAQDGMVLRIDCGMSPNVNDSTGCLLRIRSEGDDDVAEQLTADGNTTPLFRGKRAAP